MAEGISSGDADEVISGTCSLRALRRRYESKHSSRKVVVIMERITEASPRFKASARRLAADQMTEAYLWSGYLETSDGP